MPKESLCFDPAFGLTGGEDVDFFGKQISVGRVFVWCNEAEVYETVPPERWRIAFHMEKFFRIGTINGKQLRKRGLSGLVGFLKSTFAVPLRILIFLFSFPFGKHVWVLPALKLAYYGGCFLAYFGLSLMRYRP